MASLVLGRRCTRAPVSNSISRLIPKAFEAAADGQQVGDLSSDRALLASVVG